MRLVLFSYASGRCHNVDVFSLFWALNAKFHDAIRLREEGVVLATAYVGTRVELGATLPDDDVASNNLLTTVYLHAKAFGFGIASVTCATTSFFMCHVYLPPLMSVILTSV